jgi:hypothetical protein
MWIALGHDACRHFGPIASEMSKPWHGLPVLASLSPHHDSYGRYAESMLPRCALPDH